MLLKAFGLSGGFFIYSKYYFLKLVSILQSSTFPTPLFMYSTIEQKRNSLAESVQQSVAPPVGQDKRSPPVVVDSFLNIPFPSILLKK